MGYKNIKRDEPNPNQEVTQNPVLKTKLKPALPEDPKELKEYIQSRIVKRLWLEAVGRGQKSTSSARVKALELLMKKFETEDAIEKNKPEETNTLDFGDATEEELAILHKFLAR